MKQKKTPEGPLNINITGMPRQCYNVEESI